MKLSYDAPPIQSLSYDMFLSSSKLLENPPNGFELSGRGPPDRNLFYQLQSYNFDSKSRSIPGPLQRMVRML